MTLTILTKWSSVYFVFIYSVVFNFLCFICHFNLQQTHRSGLKFQTAALHVLCVMLQVQLPTVLNLFLVLPFIGQTAVVSEPNINLNQINLNWNRNVVL